MAAQMNVRRKYDHGQLMSAVGAVKAGRLNPSKASREYSVPRQTIVDHVSGKIASLDSVSGPGHLLTTEEEDALIDYVVYMGERGFPVNRQQLKIYANEMINFNNNPTPQGLHYNATKGPSDKWCRQLINRHPKLTERVPEQRDKGRMRMSNSTVVENFFKKYAEVLDELKLRGKAAQIFNCDETGFTQKQGGKRKVIGQKGKPCIQQQVSTVDHVTAHICVSGDGKVIPTFVIYQKSLPHRPFREDVPRDWLFGVSDSGFMDRELFTLWFVNVFMKHCGPQRPVLLLLDNHESHISLDVIKKARENQIHILGFPAHTTHLLQPCDVLLFGGLKEKMRVLAHSMSLINSSMVVNKAKFPPLLSFAIDSVFSPAFIKASFRKSGLIPFDPDMIDRSMLVPEDFQKKVPTLTNPHVTISDALPGPSTSNPSTEETAITNISTDLSTQEPSSQAAPSFQSNVCTECGASKAPHPLLSVQKLPKELQSLFVVPLANQPPKKKRKVVPEARIITGDEMLEQLETKERDEEEKRAGITRRKQEREEKRRKKEEQKQEKTKGKGKGKSKAKRKDRGRVLDEEQVLVDSDESDDDDVLCGMCEQRDPREDDEETTSWISCMLCDTWYHQACVGKAKENFICLKCRSKKRNC